MYGLEPRGKAIALYVNSSISLKAPVQNGKKALAAQIDELKRAELAELCESYSMTKEARIRRLGDTLEKINAALEQADFSTVDPANS